jgi:hypothetical protein
MVILNKQLANPRWPREIITLACYRRVTESGKLYIFFGHLMSVRKNIYGKESMSDKIRAGPTRPGSEKNVDIILLSINKR